jgi:hypothetical protein
MSTAELPKQYDTQDAQRHWYGFWFAKGYFSAREYRSVIRRRKPLVTDADNPYQAPEARNGQSSVQWRRPMIYTVAGSLCWFFAALLASGICYCIPMMMRIGNEPGWESFLSTKFGREAAIASVGVVIVIPVVAFAGQSFLTRRGRRGLIICFLTFGVAELIRYLTGIK